MTTKDELAARYGTPSPARRMTLMVVSVVVAVAFLAWVAWAAFFHGTPNAESKLVGYDVKDDHTVEATVQVSLDEVSEAECLVRAISVDKSVVGELAFTAAEGQQVVTLRTERRATSVDMVGCKAEGQPRWR